ncbi:carbohydrate ABC transporter permease [Streptomyces sp. NPDC060194]|uniref:carbohydrate ABC transporter permease n=1 Tax=Streptomyces sp. NPDC060194 TaxID=3347069 RepID=UPI003649E043
MTTLTPAKSPKAPRARRPASTAPSAHRPVRPGRRLAAHALVILACVLLLYPLIWMGGASLKPEDEIFADPGVLPGSPDLGNYTRGWDATGQPFGLYLLNSLLICVGAVIGNVIACSMAAYAFARLRFPFKRTLFAVMLLTIMLPHQVTLIPQYVLFDSLGWINTYLPLVVPKFLAVDAFFIFLMVQFIRALPQELDDAAFVDGCSPFTVFRRVILPLSRPALVTTAIFTFIWTWDDFLGQLVYISDPALFTAPLGLRLFIDAGGESAWGPMFAMSVLSLIPTFGFFLAFQKLLIEGISTSGLK